jgi:hypothetical protein
MKQFKARAPPSRRPSRVQRSGYVVLKKRDKRHAHTIRSWLLIAQRMQHLSNQNKH